MSPRDYLYNLVTDKINGPLAILLKGFLFLLSFLYALVVRVLILFRGLSCCRLSAKVISVGNITLGGTGKTTLVQLIAEDLKSRGRNLAILTRGYKRSIGHSHACLAKDLAMGDEPLMLQKNLGNIPVIVDSNRIRSAKKAIKDFKVDALVLDDGFQQWGIKKDLDVVTIDATNPFGNKHLLPRGILREPLSSLRRADIFVLTKVNLAKGVQDIKTLLLKINPKALIVESEHVPQYFYELAHQEKTISLEAFQGKNAVLFSGIGDPDSFEKMISNLGIKVGFSFKFADHHNYSQQDLDNIFRQAKEKSAEILITTEKDASRLYELRITDYELRIYILRITIKITSGIDKFYERIHKLYNF